MFFVFFNVYIHIYIYDIHMWGLGPSIRISHDICCRHLCSSYIYVRLYVCTVCHDIQIGLHGYIQSYGYDPIVCCMHHIYIYRYRIYIYNNMYMYIHNYTYTRLYLYIYIYIFIYIYTCISAYMYLCHTIHSRLYIPLELHFSIHVLHTFSEGTSLPESYPKHILRSYLDR